MDNSRNNGWDDDSTTYTASQVESVLEYCGVEPVSETNTHFLCYCPFHNNTDSPAYAVDKSKGLSICFNPSCQTTNTLESMIQRIMKVNLFQAKRIIIKFKHASDIPLRERAVEAMTKDPDYPSFPQEVLDKMKAEFPGSPGEEYMHSRGFDDDTLDYFDVGYSKKKGMVIVPMHDPKGNPVGLIGRIASRVDKRFKNSVNLPKSKTAWNFHRAKRCGEVVIVCEASYDAMRIHQAGFPNVIALLGGHVTAYHLDQINKHFSTVIIMTDFDKKQYRPNCRACSKYDACQGHRPGRDLGRSIAKGLSNKKILWAAYDDVCVYPHNAKDASDMTDTEIRQCLKNAISNIEYLSWDIEDKESVAV